jgi:hypothetical protein
VGYKSTSLGQQLTKFQRIVVEVRYLWRRRFCDHSERWELLNQWGGFVWQKKGSSNKQLWKSQTPKIKGDNMRGTSGNYGTECTEFWWKTIRKETIWKTLE